MEKKIFSLAEKLFLLILIISYIISGIYLILTGKYSIKNVLIIGCTVWLGYIYTLKIYKWIRQDTFQKNKFFFIINYQRLNWFMLIYMIIMIIYGIITGDGAAEAGKLNSSSIFASLWVPDAIFAFYYCLCRERYEFFARVVALFYMVYKMMLGWTGVILLVVIFELYYIFKDRVINTWKLLGLTIGSIVGGGALYSVLFPLKYSIRYGIPYDFSNRLTLFEGIDRLTKRIAHFEATLFVHEHIDKVIHIYENQSVSLAEFQAIFRPIIPSAIMHDKIFSSIGSCIYNAQSGYTGINITNNVGILYYYRLLLQCDPLSFIFCAVMFVCFIYILKKVYNSFQSKPGQFDILYFWIFVQGYSICGTLENWISNSYFKIIFFVPLFWLLGIIKVCYRTRYYNASGEVYESITD